MERKITSLHTSLQSSQTNHIFTMIIGISTLQYRVCIAFDICYFHLRECTRIVYTRNTKFSCNMDPALTLTHPRKLSYSQQMTRKQMFTISACIESTTPLELIKAAWERPDRQHLSVHLKCERVSTLVSRVYD